MPLAILPWTGSSPHTRGARPGCRRPRCLRGIIPAYAGSTLGTRRWWARMRDHPRIRGEHLRDVIIDAQQRGSSPHTRGALSEVRQIAEEARIIPAYAGSTSVWAVRAALPRGSSPHTRGALVRGVVGSEHAGIIPAYAGSTDRVQRLQRGRPDHPRIRGEHGWPAHHIKPSMGSSPHTRGAHGRPRRVLSASRDHPRIRGEHNNPQDRTGGEIGSSPHTRGAPVTGSLAMTRSGIIPAYAGSTGFRHPPRADRRDHPRIRGEHPALLPPRR